MTQVLPPVAKSFFTHCKKCEADRYHMVLTHKTATSASIECEVCHKKSTYSLPKEKSAKAKPASGRPLTGAAAKARATSESSRRNAHAAQYETLMNQYASKEAVAYSMKAKFEANQKLNHPKFGVGIVTLATPEKLDVVFQEEMKSLVHNRS